MPSNRAIILEFMTRVWRECDVSAIDELFTGEATVSGLEENDLYGAEEFKALHRMITAQFADISHEFVSGIEEGDWTAVRFKVTGVCRETGRAFKTRTMIMVRFIDGKIVEAHNHIDLIPMFEANGRLPERTLDMCLLGQRLEFVH